MVLRGRRATLLHSNLFDKVSNVSTLEEVSHEMLVFWCSHVSRLESLVFLWRSDVNVSKQVVMSFCKAGVSLCNRPTCLMMFAKFQNWRKSRRKCWFFCIHVSCRESLVFLWRRRVYGGSWKNMQDCDDQRVAEMF